MPFWLDGGVGGHYPSREPIEVGRLLVRAATGAPQAQASIRPATRVVREGPFAETYESGGEAAIVVDLTNPFSPAREFIGATVSIGDNRAFVRGDANGDGTVNLSDPVLMLNSLFTETGDLVCEDAADADDNGALNITDPILLLGMLFGGGGALPPPSTCAPDPTDDSLRCDEPCSV